MEAMNLVICEYSTSWGPKFHMQYAPKGETSRLDYQCPHIITDSQHSDRFEDTCVFQAFWSGKVTASHSLLSSSPSQQPPLPYPQSPS